MLNKIFDLFCPDIEENIFFYVDLNKLRFMQNYVKRPTIEAKKKIILLKLTYGADWMEHIHSTIYGDYDLVIKEMMKVDLTLPISVSKTNEEGIYIVRDGVHTTYSYKELGYNRIYARLDKIGNSSKKELLTIDDLIVENF